MIKPKLTIAIPTYNSSKTLLVALDSVFAQLVEIRKIVRLEVIVVDNCSLDDTYDVCWRYIFENSVDVKYFRNEENIGYDKNIDMLFKKASGDYVKILCDDDALAPGALEELFDLMDRYANAVVFVSNFDVYDERLEKVVNVLSVCDGGVCEFNDSASFFSAAKGRYGQTSSLMVSRNAWLEIPSEEAIGSLHIQVHKVLHLLDLGSGVVAGNPIIKVRTGSPNFSASPENQFDVPLRALDLFLSYKKSHPGAAADRLLKEQAIYVVNRMRGYHESYGLSPELIEVHNRVLSYCID